MEANKTRQITNSQGSKYSDAQRREAVLNYAVLGNVQKVAESTGIPYGTIFHWLKNEEWWDVLLQEVQDEKQAEIDAMYTDGIHKSMARVLDKIDDEDAKLLDLVKTNAILFDKRQLLRNQPTSIRHESTSKLLQDLAEGFRSMSQGRVIEGERVE